MGLSGDFEYTPGPTVLPHEAGPDGPPFRRYVQQRRINWTGSLVRTSHIATSDLPC